MPPRRTCLGVPGAQGCPTCSLAEPGKPRCRGCETQHQRARNASRPQYAGDWAATAKRRIAEHRAIHGDVCPGWDTPPHPVDPTTPAGRWHCDHDIGPLCAECNGRKAGSHDRARAQARRTG